MAWRRAKITELRDEMLFKREYPGRSSQAFETSGEDVLISPPARTVGQWQQIQGRGVGYAQAIGGSITPSFPERAYC